MKTLIAIIFLFPVVIFAQDASPVPGVVGAVNHIGASIPGSLPTWIVAAVITLSEIVARKFPTANPMSLFLVISAFFKGLANIFVKLSGLLDQIVGQNVKPNGQ